MSPHTCNPYPGCVQGSQPLRLRLEMKCRIVGKEPSGMQKYGRVGERTHSAATPAQLRQRSSRNLPKLELLPRELKITLPFHVRTHARILIVAARNLGRSQVR